MADRAEMFSLSTFHSLSPPGCRPAHDISLEEFDDEDLSEITDDCGIGLNYDSDPYEKDSLILEKSDMHHPVCSFQDDFQEFEMIDDEDDDDDEEEDEDEELDPDAPPSPSASPPLSPTLGELKSRPTTLNLTTAVSQDSLNNNSSLSPKRGSWQDSLRKTSHGRLSPTHSCLEDGGHVTGQCPASPVSQAPGHKSKGIPPKQAGEGGNPQSPHRPLLCDMEGNRRERPEYGSFGQHNTHPRSGEANEPRADPSIRTTRVPSVDEHSQCSDTEVDHDLNSDHNHKHSKQRATDTYTITRIADMNQQGYTTSDQDKDLSSPGSDSDIEGELEAAFSCGGPVVSNMISSISETELDLTSDESSSGRSSHLTNSIEEASSPTSDQELDLDTELEQDSGIVGFKASLLLGQPDPIKEGSTPLSPSPLPSPTIATPSPVDSPILPPESYDDGQALIGLQNMDDERSFEHQADPDETLPPAQQCEDSLSRQMVLQIEPDHSLESFKRSFYLPVGPRLMPSAGEYDETSEGDSESESEDDLSENSDSPWLLSNLVNRMISEGSYPISCPEDCFKRKVSVSDTISPSSDIGDGDGFNDEDQEKKSELGGSEEEEKEGEGYRKDVMEPGEGGKGIDSLNGGALMSPCLYTNNPTGHAITPLVVEHCANNARGTAGLDSRDTTKDCEKNLTEKLTKNARRQKEDLEPNNDLMMLESRKELDSPSLSESVVSEKDEGRETEPRPQSRSSASLERITEVKHSLKLDIPTAQTNRCFSLTYSTDNDEEEGDGDSYPFLGGLRKESYQDCDLDLDSSPPIDSSVQDHPLPDHDLPLCQKDLPLREPNEDDGLAYDSMKYTLVVDENTTLELVSLRRCTSVLSDDSELSTLCDEEPLGTSVLNYGRDDEELRPELLSSSEDSSPEADLPFSKKFLNVFVNSTSRSSSTESFGLFSCTINGEERDQTHRAVYRFIPRHADELELDVDDPLYVEEEEDDYWYRGYNMRTGERGIFPAFYANEVMGQSKELLGMKRNPAWIETFSVQFLGSVEVPNHQGNGILCAAMQKIAISRKRTVHVRPPSLCELEISLQGVKLIMSLEDDYDAIDEYDRCSHFFQMKNISFCGCHPRNNCYFGFITKHPMLSRFACHVFVSQESMRPVAECVGRAFQEYYQEHLEYACPTEDIYLE
ncbi:C-Jun-amino-terminal kinase-interacting protein 2 isoform 3-T3 [Spinachia spinachia]